MLIVPLAQKPTWATLPVATLCLLFINVFVFLFLQIPDAKVEHNFQEAYLRAKLAPMEFPQFRRWVEDKGDNRLAQYLRAFEEGSNAVIDGGAVRVTGAIALRLQSDREFLAQLERRLRSALSKEEFANWREARVPVDAIWRKNFTENYMFVPARAEPITFLTHMFMHAGFGHLLGNMVMLVLIGMLVEQAIGAWPTLLLYLLGGFGSLLFELPFHSGAWVGSLGASGAIAALMGATAALFGLRKVRFFYHVLFYFDFVMLPAIVVLPVWILNELWQWALLRHESNVAYFAHIGGLIVGAMLAFAYKSWPQKKVALTLPPEDASEENPLVTKERRARQYLAQMNWDAARREFVALAQAEPKNIGFAEQVYKLARMQPAADGFHTSALTLLSLTGQQASRQPEHAALLARTLIDYWSLAKPAPQFSASSMAKLSKLLAKQSFIDAAELPATTLTKMPPDKLGEVNLADVLLTMLAAYRRAAQTNGSGNDQTRAQHYFSLLEQRFPASEELKLARQMLV